MPFQQPVQLPVVQANGRNNSSTETSSFSPSSHPNKVGRGNIFHSIPNKGVKTRMQENPVTHDDIWYPSLWDGLYFHHSACLPSSAAGEQGKRKAYNQEIPFLRAELSVGNRDSTPWKWANPRVADQVTLAPMSFHTECLLSLCVSPHVPVPSKLSSCSTAGSVFHPLTTSREETASAVADYSHQSATQLHPIRAFTHLLANTTKEATDLLSHHSAGRNFVPFPPL